MPIRTINDAAFAFANEKGVVIHARRGDVVDIPEGYDLERGEKAGSFTLENAEPSAPSGTFMPDIDVAWEDSDYRRFVDDGTVDEILLKVQEVNEEHKAQVAAALIAAEEGGKNRKTLLDSLSAFSKGAVTIEEPEEEEEILDEEPEGKPEEEVPDDGPKLIQPKK